MTTGGGWQDQVGGALLGMRLTSAASADLGDPHEAKGMDALPDYEVRIARLPSAAAEFLSNRVACVFTGAVRLAATVARGVVDAWQRRAPGVEEALRACAAMGKDMADAFDRLGALPADAFVGEGGEDANAELEAVGLHLGAAQGFAGAPVALDQLPGGRGVVRSGRAARHRVAHMRRGQRGAHRGVHEARCGRSSRGGRGGGMRRGAGCEVGSDRG